MLNNLKKLLIPRKGSAQTDDLDTNWRAIERWANALETGGSGVYASLTGPGETTTPGDLTQKGGFEVDATGAEIIRLDYGSGSSFLRINRLGFPGAVDLASSNYLTLSASANINIQAGAGFVLAGGGVTQLGVGTDTLRFMNGLNATPGPLTVTGARGGITALASLLTQLASFGLITDGTTP